MVDHPDIWHAAAALLRKHGGDAPSYAGQRAIELFGRGDETGAEVWRRILKALDELMRTERKDDEPVN
jgi:hypothetical protein